MTPPQLPSSVVSVSSDYEVTPTQLPSPVLSVSETSGSPPKVLLVSEMEQLTLPAPPTIFTALTDKE